jgi:hypothetical protein
MVSFGWRWANAFPASRVSTRMRHGAGHVVEATV